MRLIDADALKFKNVAEVNGILTHILTAEEIDNAPTVDTFTFDDMKKGIEVGRLFGQSEGRVKKEGNDMRNYFDDKGNYINVENLSLANIYHRAFALGVESVAIKPPRGEWYIANPHEDDYHKSVIMCPCCGTAYKYTDLCKIAPVRCFPNFCPHCGADLREEGEP